MIFLLLIFSTGVCSLVYQVVWQRYLAILMGSEARASTIIIAIFLLGLSCGYILFGKLTRRFKSRRLLLKSYGWVEIATAAYALVFVNIFWGISESYISQSSHYISQVFIGLLLLIVPTILMGATIPMMTTILPKKYGEINNMHARIYGLNTLGGFLGVLLGAFILVPWLGLSMTLLVAAILNLIVGFIYAGNKLEGLIVRDSEKSYVKTRLPLATLYAWSFISGSVIVSLEILWMRILGLSIGSSYLVFPFVLSLFIGGLGYGSLTAGKITSLQRFYCEIVRSLVFLVIAFCISPWLPWITNCIRVLQVTIEPNYYIHYFIIYIILALLTLPFVVPMGRVLPAIFSFIPKQGVGQGEHCGRLYFINTIGTFVGAVVFGYLVFYLIDLPTNLKMQVIAYALIALSVLFYQKKYKSLIVLSLLLVVSSYLPYYRGFHSESLFRKIKYNPSLHWTNILKNLPDRNGVVFLEDGPDATVAVYNYKRGRDQLLAQSVFVNGKSDSNTIGDYATIRLSAILPYSYFTSYLSQKQKFDAAIIGAGTGGTAASIINMPESENVHLIEVSSSVIKALDYFQNMNDDLLTSNKLDIIQADAFRFFRGSERRFDLIISEPTNPWTIGVENLYTEYFYGILASKLSENGLFYQWFNLYASNNKILASVIKNLQSRFQYVQLYLTQQGDGALLASQNPISFNYNLEVDPNIKESLLNMEISVKYLPLLEQYNSIEIRYIADTHDYYIHDVDFPRLNYYSLKTFFLNSRVDIPQMISPYVSRLLPMRNEAARMNLLQSVISDMSYKLNKCNMGNKTYPSVYCEIIKPMVDYFHYYHTEDISFKEKLSAYAYLRKEKLILKDLDFLEDMYTVSKDTNTDLYLAVFEEYLKEGELMLASILIDELPEQNKYQSLKQSMTTKLSAQKQVMSSLKAMGYL